MLDSLLPRLRLGAPVDGETLDPTILYPHPVNDLWLEVGFGAGEHLAAQARAHPATGFIGGEPFINGVANLLTLIEAEGLDNVRIVDDDIRSIIPVLPEASVGRVFILFPDPWPKRRHHRRRIVSNPMLDTLARIMKDGAELRLASDDMGYIRWTLRHGLAHPDFQWTAEGPADWRSRPADGHPTRYESKALGAGLAPAYLTFLRCPRKYWAG